MCRFEKNSLAGFTLIEGVLGLFLVSVIVMLFQLFILGAEKISAFSSGKNSLEWHLFLSQIENRSNNWELVEIEPHRLVFFEREEGVDFELTPHKSQLKIKKRRGYEPVLTKVASSHFSLVNKDVVISVVMEDGRNYRGVFPKWTKNKNGKGRYSLRF